MSARYAFVTLVTSDGYLPGALAVAAALREVHPSPPVDPEVPFQTVCLVTPETVDVKTIKHLRRAFDSVIGVEVIEENTSAELQLLGRPDLHTVLTKLHVFRLVQFDKIIFLDADVLPIRPISHLFSLPHEFSAAPDIGWPDIFNSGVMVLSPGEDKFNEILSLVKSKGSWDGGDQGVLNEWRGSNWNRISFIYNTIPNLQYNYPPAYERFGGEIAVLHFIGENKPWKELPYRAPSSASQNLQHQHQASGSEQHVSPQQLPLSQTQVQTSLPIYAYGSLVDRWFDVYDRNYRRLVPATGAEFEAKKYSNVWDDNAEASRENKQAASNMAHGEVLRLEDLRKLAMEGGSSSSRQTGEGEYRSLPLEGRIDLMRPKPQPPRESAMLEQRGHEFSEGHVRTPTAEQPHWKGHESLRQESPPPPGPNEVPPSPHIAPLPLPPSASVSPASITQNLPSQQEGRQSHPSSQHSISTEDSGVVGNLSQLTHSRPDQISYQHTEQQDHQTQHHEAQPGEPRRPVSPPLLSWNPAIEPPPNVPPTTSAFPPDAYFPNAWDIPQSTSFGKMHDALTGPTTTTSQFFQPPPQTHIPTRLVQEGHYRNVTGPQHDKPPQPDISKVTSVFPWEQKPRHIPGRVFPEGETGPPNAQYIENLAHTEPEQETELQTPDMTQEEKTQAGSPKIQLPSPSIGFPGARGYSNAWDSVPSIQKYAARLAKPPTTSLPLTLPPPRIRKRSDSYRSRGEQSDANSMDGDVEDEVDDDDSDAGRFSSSERSNGGRSRRGSKAGLNTPPSATTRARSGKKEYRSYGVQTVPKDVRSVAVQVSQVISTSTGKMSSKNAPKPSSTAFPLSGKPHIELPKQPPVQELPTGLEPTALATPSSANVEAFIRPPPARQSHGLPTGMLSPRLHDVYTFGSPNRTPPNATPGTQTPITRRQSEAAKPASLSTEKPQPQPLPHAVVRTSSQETADSPLGPASPVDSPPTGQPKRPAGRKWDPATGVDVFKRTSEEVLARFLRLGSWEDESQSHVHHTHG